MPKYIHSKLSAQEGLVMSELSERIGTAAGNAQAMLLKAGLTAARQFCRHFALKAA